MVEQSSIEQMYHYFVDSLRTFKVFEIGKKYIVIRIVTKNILYLKV